jgi:hypothetical protein
MTEADPLSGARMYRMFEGYLLQRNQADDGSTFSRITFRKQDAEVEVPKADIASDLPAVQISVADSIAFPAFSEVVSSAVVDDAVSGCQQVWFVRQGRPEIWLDRVSLEGQRLTRKPYSLGFPHWARSIAGQAVLPWSGTKSLLVAGTSDDSVIIGAFEYIDRTGGRIFNRWTLPGSKSGSVIGSWILGDDFDSWLFVTIRTATALSTVAVDVRSLFPTQQRTEPLPPAAVHLLPDVPVAATSGASGTLGRLLSASASQQLILVATDPNGTPFVVLQGFDGAGPVELARADIDTKFAQPRSAEYRLTCADLDDNGQEELVVGYAAEYGGVSGAGAFVLFRFDQAQRKLEATSKYVAAGPNSAPLASMDLRLGSGVFGDAVTRGVLVLGAGGDLGHIIKGRVQIFAGIIPVDPGTLRFPPYKEVPATLPAVTQVAETGLTAPGILGSAADLFGLSVTLGQPVATQLRSCGQLLAILQAPPFDLENYDERPMLSITQSDERVKGLSVTSSKDWTLSDDAGVSLGIGGAALESHWSNTYGRSFSKTENASTSTGVATTRTPVELDRLVTVAIDYTVWEYPIMRQSRGQKPGGTMLVIFPGSAIPVQGTPVAYDSQFGYRSAYEPGSLLTYMNVDLDGWDETRQGELLLFTPLVDLEVTSDPEGTNTYDMTNANESTIDHYFSVAASAGVSGELLQQTRLFSYLPVSFGFNLATSDSYSNSEMQMTSLSRTESLSISVSGGRVTDVAMSFTMRPYIYQHAGLGATVVAFKLTYLGPGWRERYKASWPMLILPFRKSTHLLMSVFSRSITFEEQPGGVVHIVVEPFNRGFTEAEVVNAELYQGQPLFDEQRNPIIPTEGRIGSASGRVPALGRVKLRVPWTPGDKPSLVTAVVWGGDRPRDWAEIAWNVYPESAYALLDLPEVQDA